MPVRKIIGVFHADWGLLGTISYLFLQWTGRDRCALCDITHRGLFHAPEWRRFVRRLQVPIELHYRNRMPPNVVALGFQTPFVIAQVDDEFVELMNHQDLERCGGSIEAFERILLENAAARNISIPIELPREG